MKIKIRYKHFSNVKTSRIFTISTVKFPGVFCLFTLGVQVNVFVGGTFYLFNAVSRQNHDTALNPFLNAKEKGDF